MQKVRGYSSVKIFIFAVFLCVACALFIFCMSSEVATASAERSGGIADIIAPIINDKFDSLDEEAKEAYLSKIDHVIRKIAHFCIYATLGALFAFASLYYERTWKKHILLPQLFGSLYAASDEIHQSFVPGRGPLFTDVVLDSAGVFCGIIFTVAVAKFVIGKIQKR